MDITQTITNWYQINMRTLPWRDTKNPYHIWLSEVIMQQTRIAQGTAYWHRFVETYPTAELLANAHLDDVLKLWEGLGYYSRARNLHAGANQVMNEHNGTFPSTYEEILKIKGIGPYTAAAIASICFGEKKAVVDGNVFRVLARLKGIEIPINSTAGKKQFQSIADELIVTSEIPGDFNQGMMEFGALHCTPKKPLCMTCPFNTSCAAYQTGTIDQLPVKQKSKPPIVRHFHYFLPKQTDMVWIKQRANGDIWSHLYEFPLVESDHPIDQPNELAKLVTLSKAASRMAGPIKHILSHQRLFISFWSISKEDMEQFFDAKPIPMHQLKERALPIALKRFVDTNLLPLPHRPH